MNKLSQQLKNFFWPNRCIFCRKVVTPGMEICPDCKKKNLPPNLRYYIFIKSNSRCFQCVSPYYYSGDVKNAIHRFKFRDHPGYAVFLGKKMAEAVRQHLVPGLYSAVTYVPISKKRLKSRGYDQSELLARQIAAELSLPLEKTLEKVKNNKEQHKLKAALRKENVIGVYRKLPEADCEMKRYLLVDDIITTGYTVSECARLLKKSGAEEIVCVSAARTT